MITSRFKAGTDFQGQTLIFLTTLFGKEYFWMKDIDGTDYLAGVDTDGNPKFI